jgi:hypothetical protein
VPRIGCIEKSTGVVRGFSKWILPKDQISSIFEKELILAPKGPRFEIST